MTDSEQPKVLTSWNPITNYKILTQKRFVREQAHKAGWVIAGTVMALTVMDIFFSIFSSFRPYSETIFFFILTAVILAVIVHIFYVTRRSNLLGSKMNGIKAGLIDGGITCLALLVGGLIAHLAIEKGYGITLSVIVFLAAIANSCVVELAEIKDDERV